MAYHKTTETRMRCFEMSLSLSQMLDEYSARTGRSFRFVAEKGIRLAIDTDCRYGGEIPLVAVVVEGGVYKVPEPVALAWDAQRERLEAETKLLRDQLSETTNTQNQGGG